MAAYGRIMDAQERIAAARARAGVSDEQIDRALEACEPANAESLTDEELFVATLEAFVAALGGRLDGSTAAFGDDTITLPAREK
ncbi:MAG: hypothetical protein ACXVRW_08900 [Solirubrobacteraceae bacterium]